MPISSDGIIQRRGAPASEITSRAQIYISESANRNWSRFWGSVAAAKAWLVFMQIAKQNNLGGWFDDSNVRKDE